YGLTNRRLLILSGLREQKEDSIALERLRSPGVVLRRLGSNLEVREAGPTSMLDTAYLPFTNPSVPPQIGGRARRYRLIGLEGAGRVYGLILDEAKKSG
ncbi:MAG TPA: hypothetical protein VMT58_03195, partial [Candidatus Binataceae bacterium]|nr:hypothetical protein [Candidatus Binataceae bacterium]